MKRRKRSRHHLPSKGRLRDKADNLWAVATKHRWGNECAMCGHRGKLNAHHLIPRAHTATRYALENGLCLCKECHLFDPHRSPHQCAAGFILWLEEHHQSLAEWYFNTIESGTYRCFQGTTNAQFYSDVIRRLKQDVNEAEFVAVVGKRLAAYLDSHDQEHMI